MTCPMVINTRNAIWAWQGNDLPPHLLAVIVSAHTEQRLLAVPGIGPAAIRLIKAWLRIHKRELSQ